MIYFLNFKTDFSRFLNFLDFKINFLKSKRKVSWLDCCVEAFADGNCRKMRMTRQKIGQRFRVCFAGFSCTDNTAMSWYWFERSVQWATASDGISINIFWVSIRGRPRNFESALSEGRKMAGRKYRESADSLRRENDYDKTDKFEQSTRLSNL